MSPDPALSVTSPAPALAVAVLGLPAFVVLVLAIVLNWGR